MPTGSDAPPDRRTLVPLGAAVAVAALVVVLVLTLGSHGGGDSFSLATSATIPSGHARDAVVRDGDTVRGSGTVIAAPGRPVRFCAPVQTAGVGRGVGSAPDCPVSVQLRGADLGRLGSLRHEHGTVVGAATITGTYRGGTVAVSDQKPYRAVEPVPFHDQPPCAEPDGGWPTGSTDPSAAQRYQRRHPGTIELVALMYPARDRQVLYVVTVGDPNRVGDALLAAYGKRLCAVPGRYTPAQLAHARAVLDARVGPGLTRPDGAGGPTIDAQGHVEVTADVPVVSPGFAAVVDAQPAGLVQLRVWLRPVR